MGPHQNRAERELLDHEDPATRFASDARHWIAIYRERIDLYRDLLERAREIRERTVGQAGFGNLAGEIGVLEDQLGRCAARLEFWYSRQWELEGLQLDRETRIVTYREHSVRLTRREFQLLETLAQRAGAPMRAQQLLVEAWRDARLPEETLRTYIVRLRAKLAELDAGIQILNRPRQGYALVFTGQERRPA
jgi:DNA-binding response OmpR family regulator